MYEVIFFDYKNRSLFDCMEEINNFLSKTTFEVVSISHAYNKGGSLEILVCLHDDLDRDFADSAIRDSEFSRG